MDLHARMLVGLGAATEVSTAKGRRAGGWIRLARVRSMAEKAPRNGLEKPKPYVLAIRPVGTSRNFQFGCSCPDWIHRKSHSSETCKHQRTFLAHQGLTDGRKGIWLYKAGRAFLGVVQDRERA